MTRMTAPAVLAWAALLVMLSAGAAEAVIKVDLPVARIYGSARTVSAGTVASVDAGDRSADISLTETLKGQPPGRSLRIGLAEPPEIAAQVAPKAPVVVFISGAGGQATAVVHLADTWLLARPARQGDAAAGPAAGTDLTAWRTVQRYDAAKSFPGRTEALVRILRDLKAGKKTIQDGVSHEAFERGARAVGELRVQPSSVVPADVNGDGDLDVFVGTPVGVRLFTTNATNAANAAAGPIASAASPQGFADATGQWGLQGASGSRCAVADVDGDGDEDLLLGGTLWRRQADRFIADTAAALKLPPDGEWLAAALADVTGDDRPDAAILTKAGRLLIAENPGRAGRPWPVMGRKLWQDRDKRGEAEAALFSADWGDDGRLHVIVVHADELVRYAVSPQGAPPADFQRLTGITLSSYKGIGGRPIKVIFAAALDYDGNGRTDLLVVTAGGGVTLVNRGHGAFLVNGFLHTMFHSSPEKPLPWTKPFPFRPAEIAAVATGRIAPGSKLPRRNLLVLTKAGTLYELNNAR